MPKSNEHRTVYNTNQNIVSVLASIIAIQNGDTEIQEGSSVPPNTTDCEGHHDGRIRCHACASSILLSEKISNSGHKKVIASESGCTTLEEEKGQPNRCCHTQSEWSLVSRRCRNEKYRLGCKCCRAKSDKKIFVSIGEGGTGAVENSH